MNNKETIFTYEYSETKEHFLKDLNSKFGKDGVQDYLLRRKENGNFHLGIERAGHCGGNWYVANVTEADGKTKISGKIVYNPDENGQETKTERKQSVRETIGLIVMFVLFLPLVILGAIVFGILLLINKIRIKRSKPPILNELTKEEKLDKFMIEYLNCKKL